jgi:hypothetical protein
VALHRLNGGSTFNLYFGDLAGQRLYAVSIYPERGRRTAGDDIDPRIVRAFILGNLDLLNDPRNSVGTWLNRANGLTYLDVSATLPDREQAVELGERYNQIAIFDLERLEEVAIGGTGEEIPNLPPPAERLADWQPGRGSEST